MMMTKIAASAMPAWHNTLVNFSKEIQIKVGFIPTVSFPSFQHDFLAK
jgi:hypothetical protein